MRSITFTANQELIFLDLANGVDVFRVDFHFDKLCLERAILVLKNIDVSVLSKSYDDMVILSYPGVIGPKWSFAVPC